MNKLITNNARDPFVSIFGNLIDDFSKMGVNVLPFNSSSLKSLADMNPALNLDLPYNIYSINDKDGERKQLVIELSVSGYKEDEIEVYEDKDVLYIKGSHEDSEENKEAEDSDTKQYYFRRIAKRNFKKGFHIPEYHNVSSAILENGILKVVLDYKIPEEKQKRTIPLQIQSSKEVKSKK